MAAEKTDRSWGDFRAKPTEAMPKTTLFGSSLEMKDEQKRKDLKTINLKQYREEINPASKPPNTSLQVPGAEEVLEYNKNALAIQSLHATRAKNIVDTLEERSKYFAVGVDDVGLRDKMEASRTDVWMSKKDLDHTSEMNNVGYQNGSYNHHRYGPRPPQHQYALMGSVLKTGGDFTADREVMERHPPEAYITRPQGKRRPRPAGAAEPSSASDVPTAMELPANIRHQFGTKVCEAVLGDRDQVQRTLEETLALHHAKRHTRTAQLPAPSVADDKVDADYDSLGLALRQNIFPGYTYDHKTSHAKSTYTPDVHKRRQVGSDEWRYQRDALSTWNEQNEVHNKLHQQWQQYEESLPKLEVNWDRNAKRPPKPPSPKIPHPKPKRKVPQKKENQKIENDIVFEDIEFVTPPLTPLERPPPRDLMPGLKKDEEFWDFYDQALPLP